MSTVSGGGSGAPGVLSKSSSNLREPGRSSLLMGEVRGGRERSEGGKGGMVGEMRGDRKWGQEGVQQLDGRGAGRHRRVQGREGDLGSARRGDQMGKGAVEFRCVGRQPHRGTRGGSVLTVLAPRPMPPLPVCAQRSQNSLGYVPAPTAIQAIPDLLSTNPVSLMSLHVSTSWRFVGWPHMSP